MQESRWDIPLHVDDHEAVNIYIDIYAYYVESTSTEELWKFLHCVTGSSVVTYKGIEVCFNSMQGLARWPVAHACSCTMQFPVTYVTYLEFVNDIKSILMSNDDLTWIMDALGGLDMIC